MSANGNVDNRGFSREVDDLCTVLYLTLDDGGGVGRESDRKTRAADARSAK